MRPSTWLRIEGLALALAGAGGYFAVGADPLLFVLLVVLPDVSIAAYILGSRAGSVAYDLVHVLVGPAILLAWGLWAGHGLATAAGFAWLAHVGADRTFGLGLKYGDAPFNETHLQRV